MTYTVTVEEDPATGDLILPIPDEIIKELGWKVGDTLIWDVRQDGSVVVSLKKEEPVEKILTPGPVIWAYALVTPLCVLSGNPVWWPFWLVSAMCYYLIGDWAWRKWFK